MSEVWTYDRIYCRFFFSSRRRHTRYWRDWSSDVCSSDLEPGYGRFLDSDQEREARDLIRHHTPDELGLPFAPWSRAAVRELIRRRFAVRLAVRTMGTYLARWASPRGSQIGRASCRERVSLSVVA